MTIRGYKISQVKFNFPKEKITWVEKTLSKTQRSKRYLNQVKRYLDTIKKSV